MPPPLESTRTYQSAALLVQAGVSCLPIKADGSKSPALLEWKSLQARYATDEELTKWFGNGAGLAVIAGRISGNLEILDFDELGLYEEWAQSVRDHGFGDVLDSLVIVQTPRGGHHVYLRAENAVSGNTKLAQTAQRKTRIETRGEGGYVVAPPSSGYKLLQGNPVKVPVIEDETRHALHALARSFDEFLEPERQVDGPRPKTADTGSNRPGDAYTAAGLDLSLLEKHGWKIVGRQGTKHLLRRPGKDGRGISATSNYANTGYLYVFSTNAAPFDAERAYSPFAVYALLEQDGDFGAAASALGKQGFGEPARKPDSKPGHKRRKVTDKEDNTAEADETPASPDGEMTEFELAVLWAKSVENEFCFVEGDQWWQYAGNRWQYSSTAEAKRSVQEFLIKTGKVTPTRVRNVLFLSESILGPHKVSSFNAHPSWIPLANGVFDTATGELLPHDPLHKLTYIASYEYDEQADCSLWKRCLKEWMVTEENTTCAEWIETLQEWFGYCLVPDNRAQVSMLWNGEGGNGKGVATRVIAHLVGSDYTTAVPIEQLHNEYTRAEIYGKLIGFVNEPDPRSMQKNGNWFKAIVGGDSISARRPTEKVFTFVPTCRIIISTNELPSTRDTSLGYYRRLIMIDWRRNFSQEERDNDLDDKLAMELPGVFNWAVEGLRRYRERHKFVVPEESKKLLEGYRMHQDSLRRFIKECCEAGPRAWVPSMTFYKTYKQWCENSGERAEPNKSVAYRLGKMGYENTIKRINPQGEADGAASSKQIRCWEGIDITEEASEISNIKGR